MEKVKCSARPSGWARIETAGSMAATKAAAVAPVLRDGRGLKLTEAITYIESRE